jgi:hypothetical protein
MVSSLHIALHILDMPQADSTMSAGECAYKPLGIGKRVFGIWFAAQVGEVLFYVLECEHEFHAQTSSIGADCPRVCERGSVRARRALISSVVQGDRL